MLSLEDILLGFLLPLVAGGAIMLTIVLPKPTLTSNNIRLGWTLGVAVAYGLGHIAVKGLPQLQHTLPGEHWLLLAVLPAGVFIGVLGAVTKTPTAILWLLRLLVAAGLPLVLLWTLVDHIGEPWAIWSTGQATATLIGISIGFLLIWAALVRLEQAGPARSYPLALTCVVGATGLVIMMSDSQTIGQLAIALAAGTLGVSIIAMFGPGNSVASGCCGVMWPLLAGLLILGRFYGEMTPTNSKWILLAIAPLMAWVDQLPPVRRFPNALRMATGLAAVLIPTAAALILAAIKFNRQMIESGYF